MPRTRNPYPTEFREQLVALARVGHSVESLAREYEPCTATEARLEPGAHQSEAQGCRPRAAGNGVVSTRTGSDVYRSRMLFCFGIHGFSHAQGE